MATRDLTLVFVHGWSVTNTNTYGGLPARLRDEAKARGVSLAVKHVFLGRYISFHDEVRLPDVSRAFRSAIDTELKTALKNGKRFVCITHSTGGPAVRDWWHRYYASQPGSGTCPMSHLIMLAPANFGSALAQLGKGRIGRLKSWFGGVEPGQGVLDWLELGSAEAWDLNADWIENGGSHINARGVFPFVMTGQTIDRKFYDNLNSYTGETGSDGVVRVASANLNTRLIRLEQEAPRKKAGRRGVEAPRLLFKEMIEGPETALRIVGGAAHSGTSKGIMRSVKPKVDARKGKELVDSIFECIAVATPADYRKVAGKQKVESAKVQKDELVEVVDRILLEDTVFIHDRYSMVVFRIRDDEGYPVTDFDLVLTAGEDSSPNKLPKGFFVDRQCNRISRNTITYYFNHDAMVGTDEPVLHKNDIERGKLPGAKRLGLKLMPRPSEGFVRYLDCEIQASAELLEKALQPNSTTLIDIELRRIVSSNVFGLSPMRGNKVSGSFKSTRPGKDIVK